MMEKKTITKSDLARRLVERDALLDHRDAFAIVDTFFESISEALAAERRVELRGFGIFTAKRRSPRRARNPRTGEDIDVDERATVSIRAGKELFNRLNK